MATTFEENRPIKYEGPTEPRPVEVRVDEKQKGLWSNHEYRLGLFNGFVAAVFLAALTAGFEYYKTRDDREFQQQAKVTEARRTVAKDMLDGLFTLDYAMYAPAPAAETNSEMARRATWIDSVIRPWTLSAKATDVAVRGELYIPETITAEYGSALRAAMEYANDLHNLSHVDRAMVGINNWRPDPELWSLQVRFTQASNRVHFALAKVLRANEP